MLIETERKLQLDRLRRQRPYLPFAGDLHRLLVAAVNDVFPALNQPPEWFFVQISFLACISRKSKNEGATIFLHPLLNRAETPTWIFQHIFVHELLHLIIPPREVDGRIKTHPAEFWEAEKLLSPDCDKVSDWLWWNYRNLLNNDRKNDCIRVRRGWQKRMHEPTRDLPEQCCKAKL
jgi:hypothetical protein